MRDLIEFVAKSLVDDPDAVRIRSVEREEITVLELEVAPADLGKVIGRQGRTARAIRTLLAAAGQKTRRRYSLDILD
ncbi:MAG TPA: KH domain-containing protein [Thermoanaerobaculia bacterium]